MFPGSIRVGASDQPLNVNPALTDSQSFLLEQGWPLNPGDKAFCATTRCGHVGIEGSQGSGSRRNGRPAPTLRASHRQEGIHLFQGGIFGATVLLGEPCQECPNMPAAAVDGSRRQATLSLHVPGKLVNEISAGPRASQAATAGAPCVAASRWLLARISGVDRVRCCGRVVGDVGPNDRQPRRLPLA